VDWQLAAVIVCILAAAAYVARAAWRTWHPKPGSCGGGCGSGCASTTAPPEPRATLIPLDQVADRRRS
jgi:hypothetical protein